MFFGNNNREKSVSDLRHELIDDTYALAFGGGCPEAIMEVSDIERMSDKEILQEAKRRGIL